MAMVKDTTKPAPTWRTRSNTPKMDKLASTPAANSSIAVHCYNHDAAVHVIRNPATLNSKLECSVHTVETSVRLSCSIFF